MGRNPSNGRVRIREAIETFEIGKTSVLSSSAGIEMTQMDELAL